MKQSVGKDAMLLMVSRVFTMLFSLVSVMLLSRFRTLEEYGTYSQILTTVSLAVTILLLGLPNCLNYFLPRTENEKEKASFLLAYFSLCTGLSVLAGVFLVILLPLIEEFYSNPGMDAFVYAFAILPWGNVIFGSLSNLLVASNKTKRVIVINLVYSATMVLAVVITKLLGGTFQFYMILYVGAQSLFALLAYYEAKKIVQHFSLHYDFKLIKSILVFSVPIGLASAVGTLNIELGKLIIGGQFDTETLAIYTNASKELPFAFVAASFTSVLLPVMSRLFKEGEKVEALRLWGRSIEFSYIIICFFITALIVFAPQAISFLYSEKYIGGTDAFRVCCLVLLCRITYFGMILNVSGNTRMVFWSSIVSLIVNIILCFALTPIFGITGPAFAALFSIALVAIIQLVYGARVIEISFSKVFPWRSIGKVTLVNFGLAVVMLAGSLVFNIQHDASGVAAAAIITVTLLVIYLLGYKKTLIRIWQELR